jgi:hypothetical protein
MQKLMQLLMQLLMQIKPSRDCAGYPVRYRKLHERPMIPGIGPVGRAGRKAGVESCLERAESSTE